MGESGGESDDVSFRLCLAAQGALALRLRGQWQGGMPLLPGQWRGISLSAGALSVGASLGKGERSVHKGSMMILRRQSGCPLA